jgi:hypothetical protein
MMPVSQPTVDTPARFKDMRRFDVRNRPHAYPLEYVDFQRTEYLAVVNLAPSVFRVFESLACDGFEVRYLWESNWSPRQESEVDYQKYLPHDQPLSKPLLIRL